MRILLHLLISIAGIFAAPFLSKWRTQLANETVFLPVIPGITYEIDWGEGNGKVNVTTPANHTYLTPGPHTISIDPISSSYIENWDFQALSASASQIIEITQWGRFSAGPSAFYGCLNLASITAVDQPTIFPETMLDYFFKGCSSLNSPLDWPDAPAYSMNYMFQDATSFNSPVTFGLGSTLKTVAGMFQRASSFNQLVMLTGALIEDLREMFADATTYNKPLQLDLTMARSVEAMFKGAISFNQPFVFNTPSLNTAQEMFANARAFNSSISLTTTSVTSMKGMFQDAISFNQPVAFDTTNVLDMSYMFSNATAFNQSLNFSTGIVTTMVGMFSYTINFNQPLFFTTTSVTNMSAMFRGAVAFNAPLQFTTSALEDASFMFAETMAYDREMNLDFTTVRSFRGMFQSADKFNNGNVTISSWVTASATSMAYMFANTRLFNVPINFFDAPVLNDTEAMFLNALSFNSVANIAMGGVINMRSMFSGAIAFNQEVIMTTSVAVDVSMMFMDAKALNQPVTLNLENVVNMMRMFMGASSFNQPLPSGTLSMLTNMQEMFKDAISFNQLINFFTPGVTNMQGMFKGAIAFNQSIVLNFESVIDMSRMFEGATSFNIDIDFGSSIVATNVQAMFKEATSFNREVGFDTSSVRNMQEMFMGATSFNQPVNIAMTNLFDISRMFKGATSFDSYVNFGGSFPSTLDMTELFANAISFNQYVTLDSFGGWADMTGLFSGASAYNQAFDMPPTVNVSGVVDMFNGATTFNQDCTIRTLSAPAMTRMFYNATSFNSTLNVNTSSVEAFDFMFALASSFNQPVDFVTHAPLANLSHMFYRATAFNQPVHFDLQSNVSSTAGMFAYATSFNAPVVCNSTFAVSTEEMFLGASSYNLPLNLDTRAVLTMKRMFAYATAFDQPLLLDSSAATDMDEVFLGTNFKENITSQWQAPNAVRCANFCANCALPAFPMCSACSVKVSVTTGFRLCNCPLNERTVSATQCGALDTSCSNCDVIVNKSGTVIVGNVSVTIPSTLIGDTGLQNVTIRIVVVPFDPNTTLEIPGGDSVVSIVVQSNGVDRPGTVNLSSPIEFVIPFKDTSSQSASLECGNKLVPQCVWWNNTAWVNSGCTATSTPSGTLCSCNHLTDFAVLLARVLDPCNTKVEFSDLYTAFAVLYSLVVPFCLVMIVLLLRAILRDKKKAKKAANPLLVNYSLIGTVAFLRLLSCLQFLDLLGDNIGARAFFVACPYLLEYFLFSRLAATWIGLVHFSMLSGDSVWLKIRPAFIGLNVLGACCVVAVFVAFCVEMSQTTEIAGTAVLASFHFMFAIVFQTYAWMVVRTIRNAPAASSSASPGSSRKFLSCGLADRLEWLGRGVTYSFALQALSNIVAVCEPSQLEGWTAVFLTSNLCALCCLMVVYLTAAQRILQVFRNRETEREREKRERE